MMFIDNEFEITTIYLCIIRNYLINKQFLRFVIVLININAT